jgi:hypothetical protein
MDHFGNNDSLWGAVFEKASDLSAAIVIGPGYIDVF